MADKNRKFESSTISPQELKRRPKPVNKRESRDSAALEPEQFSRQLINRLIDRLKGT